MHRCTYKNSAYRVSRRESYFQNSSDNNLCKTARSQLLRLTILVWIQQLPATKNATFFPWGLMISLYGTPQTHDQQGQAIRSMSALPSANITIAIPRNALSNQNTIREQLQCFTFTFTGVEIGYYLCQAHLWLLPCSHVDRLGQRVLVHGGPLPRSKLNPENTVENYQNLSCINCPGIWLNLRLEKQPPGPTVRNQTQIMRTTSCNREVLYGFCQLIKRAVKRSLEFRCTAPYLAYCSSTAKLGAT